MTSVDLLLRERHVPNPNGARLYSSRCIQLHVSDVSLTSLKHQSFGRTPIVSNFRLGCTVAGLAPLPQSNERAVRSPATVHST